MTLAQKRILTLVIFGLIFSALVYLLFFRSRGEPTVILEDIRQSLDQLVQDRTSDGEDYSHLFDPTVPYELIREPLPEEVCSIFHPGLKMRNGRLIYDPITYCISRPNLDLRRKFPEHPDGGWPVVTNDYGFRNDQDLLKEKPDYRILVTGDSHTEGLVPNRDSFTNVLGARLQKSHPDLTIEALNGGTGGYSFHNYIGVIEKRRELDPDLFIMAVFGGNDFSNMIPFLWYFHGIPAEKFSQECTQKKQEAVEKYHYLLAQEFGQVFRLHNRPGDIHFMVKAATTITVEISKICKESGIDFILVYIPGFFQTQPQYIAEEVKPLCELLEIEESEININDELADRYLAEVKKAGIFYLDMRQFYRDSPTPVYWISDSHINTLGHRLIADELFPIVEEKLQSR